MIGGPDLDLGRPDAKVRLLQRDGLTLVMEASPRADIEINGTVPLPRTALHHGDLISIGGVELVFGYFDEAREPSLEAAIARDPDAEGPWLVYSDWLQERGDPLGERIAQPQRAAADPFWLEGLDVVEVTWRRGMIEKAVFREGLGAHLGITRRQITRLLSLRAAAFLRELVVDLLADERTLERPAIQQRVAELVAQLPALPALERLCVGYHLADEEPLSPLVLKDARFPRLAAEPVFLWVREDALEVLDSVRFIGGRKGDSFGASGRRIAEHAKQLHATRIGDARDTICSFDEVGGRVRLQISDGFERRVRINGYEWGLSAYLLPGDLIEVFGENAETCWVRLRFNPV